MDPNYFQPVYITVRKSNWGGICAVVVQQRRNFSHDHGKPF
jgi:hypothetical protein